MRGSAPNGKPIIRGGHCTQTVRAGAAILLDDKAMKHGIVLVHPELPLFKLFLKIDPETKRLSQHFEKVTPVGPHIRDYGIEIVEDDIAIVQPKQEIIIPGRG